MLRKHGTGYVAGQTANTGKLIFTRTLCPVGRDKHETTGADRSNCVGRYWWYRRRL